MARHIGRRHKVWVKLQRLSKAVFEYDPDPAQWDDIYTVPASITPTQGRELIDGDKMESHITHLVTIRWMPAVHSSWRVVIEDGSKLTDAEKRILEIDSVIDWQDRRKYLTLKCIEQPTAEVPPTEVDFWIWQNSDLHTWQNDDPAIWQDGTVAPHQCGIGCMIIEGAENTFTVG